MEAIIGYLLLAVIAPFVAFLKYAPRPLSIAAARIFIWILLAVIMRRNPVGLRNLQIAFPEKSLAERKRILYCSYNILAENLREFARLDTLTKEKAAAMLDWSEAREIILKAKADAPGLGVFFPTAHFGSYETVVQCYSILQNPVSILARGLGNCVVDSFINSKREKYGSNIFARKGGYREIEKAILSGRDVAALVDQNVKRNHAVFVDFFGVKAATTKAVALTALRTGCAVVFNACLHVAEGRYRLLSTRIHIPTSDSQSLEQKLEDITQQVNYAIESAIRQYPEQWMWIHRRFKTRPAGEQENLYAKSLMTVSTR